MVSIHKPHTLIELAMTRSILAAHDIPYFVHNGGYASLYPGMQMELFNVPTVMVPPSAAEWSKELLRAYLPEVEDHLHPTDELSGWHVTRMFLEAMLGHWLVRRVGPNRYGAAGELSVRPGMPGDAAAISAFVLALSEEFIVGDFTPAGRAQFLVDHTEAKVDERLGGDFRFYLAEHEDTLAGVAAIRANTHLYYLFVGKAYQRAGLARRLWARVRDDSMVLGNPGRFTVNASNYAVPAYESLGFRRIEPTRETNGVLYNPMELTASRPTG